MLNQINKYNSSIHQLYTPLMIHQTIFSRLTNVFGIQNLPLIQTFFQKQYTFIQQRKDKRYSMRRRQPRASNKPGASALPQQFEQKNLNTTNQAPISPTSREAGEETKGNEEQGPISTFQKGTGMMPYGHEYFHNLSKRSSDSIDFLQAQIKREDPSLNTFQSVRVKTEVLNSDKEVVVSKTQIKSEKILQQQADYQALDDGETCIEKEIAEDCNLKRKNPYKIPAKNEQAEDINMGDIDDKEHEEVIQGDQELQEMNELIAIYKKIVRTTFSQRKIALLTLNCEEQSIIHEVALDIIKILYTLVVNQREYEFIENQSEQSTQISIIY